MLQLIPNIYMFAALVKQSWRTQGSRRIYNLANGVVGFSACCIGIGVAFIPTSLTGSIWVYEDEAGHRNCSYAGRGLYSLRNCAMEEEAGRSLISRDSELRI